MKKNTPVHHFDFLFNTLSSYSPVDEVLKNHLRSLSLLEFQPGETILLKGKAPVSAYFIAEGAARTTHLHPVTKERIPVWLWRKGDFVTAFNCFLKQYKTSQSIEVITTSVLIEMPYDRLHEMFEAYPVSMLLMLMIQEKFISHIDEHRLDLLTLSAREIKDKYELNYPDLFQHFKLKEAAGFLGMKRETLSRLRH